MPCSNAAKTRNPMKFAGVPQIPPNRSQPLVGRSSPYCGDIWRRYCCLISFFRLSICALVAKIWPDKVVRWCRDGDFLRPVFTASRTSGSKSKRNGSASKTVLPGTMPTIVPSGILIHPAVWPQQTWAENWGAMPPFWEGELVLHLAQCVLSRRLPPYQVAS